MPAQPFTAFNFDVEIHVPAVSPAPICGGVFSECDGLEATMDVKTIREGGDNTRQLRLIGPVGYGAVTLKRGLTTASADLWQWFESQQTAPHRSRGTAKIVFRGSDRAEAMVVTLDQCLLTKLKAPALSAKDGAVAIEELQLMYESMSFAPGVGNE